MRLPISPLNVHADGVAAPGADGPVTWHAPFQAVARQRPQTG